MCPILFSIFLLWLAVVFMIIIIIQYHRLFWRLVGIAAIANFTVAFVWVAELCTGFVCLKDWWEDFGQLGIFLVFFSHQASGRWSSPWGCSWRGLVAERLQLESPTILLIGRLSSRCLFLFWGPPYHTYNLTYWQTISQVIDNVCSLPINNNYMTWFKRLLKGCLCSCCGSASPPFLPPRVAKV